MQTGDYRGAIEMLSRCASAQTSAQLRGHLLIGLIDLLGADSATYIQMRSCPLVGRQPTTPAGDSSGALEMWQTYPMPPRAIPGALSSSAIRYRDHPMFVPMVVHRQDTTLRMSDVLAPKSFQRSSFCQDFFKPRGVRFALYSVIGRSADIVATIGALRDGPDFSVRERSLLELVRVPLAGMWQQARSADRMRLELTASIKAPHLCRPIDTGVLTPAEDGVVRLVTSGMSNRAVATVLNISVKGVEQHLSHVYRKLAVESRTQLILRINGFPESAVPGT